MVLVGEKVYFIRYENVNYGSMSKLSLQSQHLLSLPFFVFLGKDIKQGLSSLSSPQSTTSTVTSFMILAGNLITQLVCVFGVNHLTSVRKTICVFCFMGYLCS
jgi:UAA transporter family